MPDDFTADITSYHHMYPFGIAQPGRVWEEFAVPFYRYGYNGMETDPEHKGEWGDYTTYFRQYDPRLGRWMSQDPIVHAWESPYAAMFDNPIVFADPSGAEGDNPLDPQPRRRFNPRYPGGRGSDDTQGPQPGKPWDDYTVHQFVNWQYNDRHPYPGDDVSPPAGTVPVWTPYGSDGPASDPLSWTYGYWVPDAGADPASGVGNLYQFDEGTRWWELTYSGPRTDILTTETAPDLPSLRERLESSELVLAISLLPGGGELVDVTLLVLALKDGDLEAAAVQAGFLLLPAGADGAAKGVRFLRRSANGAEMTVDMVRGADNVTGGASPTAIADPLRNNPHPNAHGHSVRDINPGYPGAGRAENCVNCAVATDATLGGNPAVAMPGSATSIGELETLYGTTFRQVTAGDITNALQEAGPGARGIVFGSNGPGQVGHVFNVVNQGGVIRFLDGQVGKEASTEGYQSLWFIRTN